LSNLFTAGGVVDKIALSFIFVLSVLIALGSIPLKIGTLANPGPGFFPFVAGALLGIISLSSLIEQVLFATTKREQGSWPAKDGMKRLIQTSIGLILYIALLEKAGFILVTFFLLTFLFWRVGYQRWYISWAGGVLFTLFFFLLFRILLKVPFPKGWMGI
jgi:hypothetical protein